MKLLILVSDKDSMLRKIKDYLPSDYTLLEGEMTSKSLHFLNNVVLGTVLVDATAGGAMDWMEQACSRRPDLTYLGFSADQNDIKDSLRPYFYDFIYTPFSRQQICLQLRRAWERVMLQAEAHSLKKDIGDYNRGQNPPAHFFTASHHKEHVLREFSKALTNNFNRERLLRFFVNTIVKLVPVGKLSILLYDEGKDLYEIALQEGLDPQYASGLCFKPSMSLISWLSTEGRLLRMEENMYASFDILAAEALQQMKLLQAVVCIPLLAQGQLVGVLSIGPKITGSSFYEEELEVFFNLCGNVAIALRDIALYHKIRDQKTYTESILRRMNSGVVAIDREECITTFNFRAGEILELSPQKAMGKDLRILPSPLGDLLYETSVTGKSFLKEEIELASGKITLEITAYQLLNAEGISLGSVMIFDDVSSRKQLEVERRQADQLDVLNKFVGQLAHEIKNPMVAIQTFAELLTEKYDDSSFRNFFTHTVSQEIKRLNELVEQLIAFSTPLSYKYSATDIHEILDMGLLLLQEQGMGQDTTVETNYERRALKVKADKILLARAFSYLLRDAFQAVERGGILHIHTYCTDKSSPGNICVCFSDDKTKAENNDTEKMFEPLTAQQNGYISLGLPVSRKIIEDHGGSLKAVLAKRKLLEIEIALPIFTGERELADE